MLPDHLEGTTLTHLVILAYSADFLLILAPRLPRTGAASTWERSGCFVPCGAASREVCEFSSHLASHILDNEAEDPITSWGDLSLTRIPPKGSSTASQRVRCRGSGCLPHYSG